MALLEVKDLYKSFESLQVLRGISFSLEQGETLSVIGPSGGGKTTLLRILTGLEAPDCGEITGVPARIAMVFQEDRLVIPSLCAPTCAWRWGLATILPTRRHC